jgi:uncharacterized membrane protein
MQMVVGALALAYPVAAAEDSWVLGAELAMWRIVVLQLGSMIIIGFYVYASYHRASTHTAWSRFVKRIGSIYLVTLLVSAGVLLVLDKFPLDDIEVAIGRTVVVAFPASFAATIVDSLDVAKSD